jgi:hypothetical protein
LKTEFRIGMDLSSPRDDFIRESLSSLHHG